MFPFYGFHSSTSHQGDTQGGSFMKWTLLVSIMAAGTLAHAADKAVPEGIDLSQLSQSPLQLLEGFQPERRGGDHDNGGPGAHKMPQACVDAAITDDQHKQIEQAVFSAEKDRVQIQADLKVAIMDYVHTLSDSTSDLAAGTAAGALITDGVSKMTNNNLALKNNIIYTILTPAQRTKAVQCLMILERAKMERKLGKICKDMPHHGRPGHGGGHHGKPEPMPTPAPTPGPQPQPTATPAPQPQPTATPAPQPQPQPSPTATPGA
jgi:hypothetical protein